MDERGMRELLERCTVAGSPSGREGGLSDLVRRQLDERGIAHETDAAGNVRVRIDGSHGERPLVLVTAHTDEVGMTVKRVEEDGRLRLSPLGGVVPHKFGEGPVDVLGDRETVPGVLSFGSVHATDESGPQFGLSADGAVATQWKSWWVETKQSPAALREAGVRPGSTVTPAASRRQAVALGPHHVSGYGLDDKAGIPVLVELAERLTATPPASSVVLAFTTREEIGGLGAAWAAAELRPEVMIAVEIAPVMPEYGVESTEAPVLWNKDVYGVADAGVVRALHAAAETRGIELQSLVSEIGASDASCAARAGHAARPATIAFPGENTHGWEIVNVAALARLTDVLEELLRRRQPW